MTKVERPSASGARSTAVVAVTDPGALQGAREQVEQVVAQFDQACSRFRDDSELSG